MINIEKVDHLGIRVTDPKRALDFYKVLGFELHKEVDYDASSFVKNPHGVEINFIVNGVDLTERQKHSYGHPREASSYTHVALRVELHY